MASSVFVLGSEVRVVNLMMATAAVIVGITGDVAHTDRGDFNIHTGYAIHEENTWRKMMPKKEFAATAPKSVRRFEVSVSAKREGAGFTHNWVRTVSTTMSTKAVASVLTEITDGGVELHTMSLRVSVREVGDVV